MQPSRPRPTRVETMSAHFEPHHSGRETAIESFREDRAAANVAILGRQDVPGNSFEENLCHHSLVFVIEKMAVKDGHAPDYGVAEVHDDVDGAAIRNIDGV
jgi:hypothetical protein